MTIEQLNNYRHAQQEIDELRRRIKILQDEAESISVNLSGMPRGNSSDKLGQVVSEYVDLSNELEALLQERIKEQRGVMRYINNIADTRTRLIFYYRFIEGLKWDYVAAKISSVETEDSCRMTAFRYIKNHSI